MSAHTQRLGTQANTPPPCLGTCSCIHRELQQPRDNKHITHYTHAIQYTHIYVHNNTNTHMYVHTKAYAAPWTCGAALVGMYGDPAQKDHQTIVHLAY